MATTPGRKAAPPTTLDDEQDLVRALWYGDPGRGKTTSLASLARLGKIVYVDAENRLHRGPLQRLGVPVANIERIRSDQVTFENLERLALDLRQRFEDGDPIIGVCFDSITEIYKLLLEQVVEVSVRRAAMRSEERNPLRTYQEDYGDMTEMVRRLLRRFRDLPCHLGFSALTRRDNDETGQIRLVPALTPSVRTDVVAFVDFMLYTQYTELEDPDGGMVEEYSAIARPRGRFDAKDTYGVLPPTLVNPTFDRLVAYANGDIERAADPQQIAARELRDRIAKHQAATAA